MQRFTRLWGRSARDILNNTHNFSVPHWIGSPMLMQIFTELTVPSIWTSLKMEIFLRTFFFVTELQVIQQFLCGQPEQEGWHSVLKMILRTTLSRFASERRQKVTGCRWNQFELQEEEFLLTIALEVCLHHIYSLFCVWTSWLGTLFCFFSSTPAAIRLRIFTVRIQDWLNIMADDNMWGRHVKTLSWKPQLP